MDRTEHLALFRLVFLLAAGALTAAAGPSAHAQAVRVDAASAGRTFAAAALEEFKKQRPASRVKLDLAGSAGSLRRLCAKQAEVAIVARPILKDELAACDRQKVEFVELPLAFDAIAVIANPRNAFVGALSVEDLRRIWEADAQGRITRWSQVNPGYPNAPLKLLGPDRLSGEPATFAASILGPGNASRRDYMVSADDNVLVRGVARDPNALGYVSVAYYNEHPGALKAVPVSARPGAPAFLPTAENIASGLYQPLSRPLFLYVSAEALASPSVREFVEFSVANGVRFARAAQIVPLPDSTYQRALARLRAPVKGTAWNGEIPIGLTPAELQKRQPTL